MIVAVLSGKGGAGKTFVSTNLAFVSKNSCYVDCDVEEPNGRIFLKPVDIKEIKVYKNLPVFDEEKCSSCRKCVDLCKFNALIFAKDKPIVFDEVCHSCGLCEIVCKDGAITEKEKEIGTVLEGRSGEITTLTGILNIGESSGIPIINKELDKALALSKPYTIIDCPPGSACSVMESVCRADICIIVVEPTKFGFHNFKMVYELALLMEKKVCVVINKETSIY